MTDYLLFQLYGPMAAWGDVAVGEARVTATHPGRSALIGFLAAAVGVRREDEEQQRRMAEGYWFAVRVVSAGSFLRDYHTAQVPSKAAMKGCPGYTRRDELALPKDDLGTILSSRDYRTDAYYHVAVEAQPEAAWSLESLRRSLEAPRFPIYLGRKSCPVALPLQPQIVPAANVASAFAMAQFTDPDALMEGLVRWRSSEALMGRSSSLYWDEKMNAGVAPRESFTRRDQPRTRRRWQFDERQENHAPLSGKE
jgi:CRISPR system Cascade subunit CasD